MVAYKPKLVEQYGRLSFGVYEWMNEGGIAFPDITSYGLEASVRNATAIKLGITRKQLTAGTHQGNPEPPRIKSINLDWSCTWSYWSPLGVQISALFRLCQSSDRCETFVASPNAILYDEFRKFSQWWITTNTPPLQFRSSRKGTGRLEHVIKLNVKNATFYNGTWSELFEEEMKNLVLKLVADIRMKLRHDLDVWFDEHVFPEFARRLNSSEDFAWLLSRGR